jgi:hypothetical protein
MLSTVEVEITLAEIVGNNVDVDSTVGGVAPQAARMNKRAGMIFFIDMCCYVAASLRRSSLPS